MSDGKLLRRGDQHPRSLSGRELRRFLWIDSGQLVLSVCTWIFWKLAWVNVERLLGHVSEWQLLSDRLDQSHPVPTGLLRIYAGLKCV